MASKVGQYVNSKIKKIKDEYNQYNENASLNRARVKQNYASFYNDRPNPRSPKNFADDMVTSYKLPFMTTDSPEYKTLRPEQKLGTEMPKLLLGMTGSGKMAQSLMTAKGLLGVGAITGLGGGLNKAGGGSFREGATRTIATLPTTYGIGGFTNPAIAGVASKVGKASPVLKTLAPKLTAGALGLPEGYTMNRAMNIRNYTPVDAALDFGLNALGQSPSARLGIRGSDALDSQLKDHLQTLQKKLASIERAGGSKKQIRQVTGAINDTYKQIVKNRQGMGIVADGKKTADAILNEPSPDIATSRTNLTGEQLKKTNAELPAYKITADDVQKSIKTSGIDDITQDMDVKQAARATGPKQKVHILNLLSTPEHVLNKIGMSEEMKGLRTASESYRKELQAEVGVGGRLTKWHERVPDAASSERMFDYLDGQKVVLSPQEEAVAKEIKTYLADWADRLKLPQDKRVSNYITHLFEKGEIEKDFDPEFAKLINDKAPKSVYDPFLEKRLGKQNYKRDVWLALDAYVKRAVRKANMDPALEPVALKAETLDRATYEYIKNYTSNINMRPTKSDEMVDNLIKSVAGYQFTSRPTAYLSRKWRRWVYRGTLGLNVGSALKNLTQGVNTYAKLGEKYTALGYTELAKKMAKKDLSELQREGILADNIIQDKTISHMSRFTDKMDSVIFAPFQFAEKVNRGSAYFGAKKKALNKGMSETDAIEYAKKIVRETQFTFGDIDTPLAFAGDVNKTLLQLLSYPVKQTEFLTNMVKNKEAAGLVRYTAGSLVLASAVGELLGVDWNDFIPFSDGRFMSPAVQTVGNAYKTAFGDEQDKAEGKKGLMKLPTLMIPAGVQASKTISGVKDYAQGYSGKPDAVRYPIEKTPSNLARAVGLGTYRVKEAKEYFDEERRPLSENQSKMFVSGGGPEYYDRVMNNRTKKKEIEAGKTKKSFLPFAKTASAATEDIIYLEQTNGDIKTIDLSKYKTKPRNQIEQIRQNKSKFQDATEIFRNETLTDQDKIQTIQKLGVNPRDVMYYDIASDSAEVRRAAVDSVMGKDYENREALLKGLVVLRKEVGSERILTDTVIDDLYNDDLISTAEKKFLKSIKFDGKKPVIKGSAKKSGSKKMPKITAGKFPVTKSSGKLALESMKAPSASLGSAKQKPRIMTQNQINLNLQSLKSPQVAKPNIKFKRG